MTSPAPQRLFSLIVLLFLAGAVEAQQPFITDDADVTPKRKFHFEFSNEHDFLQRSARPAVRQNIANVELDYGLFDGVEIGIDGPLLTISNQAGTTPRSISGIGDVNVHVKYNFLKEREHSQLPAMAISFNLELPTGDKNRQLGSGLADFYFNGILQKTIRAQTTLRINGGILFSGNETTGVLGIRSRGRVFTAGGSLVKQFSEKLDLGVEVTGAMASDFQLGKGQLQAMAGGNYVLRENVTFDFGIVAGRYTASPRVGLLVGVSVDF